MNTWAPRLRSAVRLPVAFLAFGCLAFASTIIVATGVDTTRGVSNLWINEQGTDTQAYFTGVIEISVTDSSGHVFNRDSFCVDLFTDININTQYNTTVLSPSQVPGKNLGRVSWLVDNALLPTQNSNYTSQLPQADWVTTSAQGAGLQLAIWDIVHDNGDGFSSGSVQAAKNHTTTSSVLNWARTYETLSANKDSNLAYIYQNVVLGGTTAVQMLAGPLFTDGGPAPVPEPSTLACAAGALVLIGLRVRKKRRRPASDPT